jgi:hypothetical protein
MPTTTMREILPGVHHWTGYLEAIGARVSSYLVEAAGIVIDPVIPDEGMESLSGVTPPREVMLTSGHHLRDAPRFAEEFGCPIRALAAAAERIGDRAAIEVVVPGEQLEPNVTAIPIGVLAPDEAALHIDHGTGMLALADAVTRDEDGELCFFADRLLGDDPEAVKQGLKAQLRLLLARPFDTLLLAHAEPVVGDGHRALKAFATS